MKKILIFIVLLIVFSNIALAGELKKDLAEKIKKVSPNERISVIIKFHKKPLSAEISSLKSEGASLKHEYKIIDGIAVNVPARVVDKLAKKNFVKLVELDYEVKLVLDTSTKQINANKAWELGITGKDIDVAVLDTGIFKHSALSIAKEIDFTGEGVSDLHGHGTHVAGIIASRDAVYKGVANESNLFNVKVLNKYGSGYSSDIIKGLEWSADNGAEIVSLSLGARITPCDGSDAMSQAVDNIVSKGVVVIVAAGNSGPDAGTITSPGCSKDALTVGAVDDNNNIATFSSRGPTSDGRTKPDIVAPGVSITSTWIDNSFKSLSGTSMATPHVSGVAALLLQADPSMNVKQTLTSSSIDLGLDKNSQGSGIVDANNSIAPLIKTAELSIIDFKANKTTVNIGDSFSLNLTINNSGNGNAKEVVASLDLPSGLTTDNLVKNIGEVSYFSTLSIYWIVKSSKQGTFDVNVNVTSLNTDTIYSSIKIEVLSQQTNQTNQTKKIPPGILKKISKLPPGISSKLLTNPNSFLEGFNKFMEEFNKFYSNKTKKTIDNNNYTLPYLPPDYDQPYNQPKPDEPEQIDEKKTLPDDQDKKSESIQPNKELTEYRRKSIEVLKEVYQKAPEQARPAIERAIEKQYARDKEQPKMHKEERNIISENSISVESRTQASAESSVSTSNVEVNTETNTDSNISSQGLPAQASATAKSKARARVR